MQIRKLSPDNELEANRLFALAFEESSPVSNGGWFDPEKTWGAFDERGRLVS